jgi:hypothetical protein
MMVLTNSSSKIKPRGPAAADKPRMDRFETISAGIAQYANCQSGFNTARRFMQIRTDATPEQ